MQIIIPDQYKHTLSSATKLAGFKWGKKGTPTAALIAIASGTHQLIPTNGSHEGNQWISIAMDFIESKTPIEIKYKTSNDTIEVIYARYAEIIRHELRYHLEIWSTQIGTDDNLPYNQCLQFDRIVNIKAAIAEWRSSLDMLEVEFCLDGKLTDIYIPKPADILDERHGDKRVIRRLISNTSWFIREIILYGENCEIIYPQQIQDLLIDQLKSTLDRYQD